MENGSGVLPAFDQLVVVSSDDIAMKSACEKRRQSAIVVSCFGLSRGIVGPRQRDGRRGEDLAFARANSGVVRESRPYVPIKSKYGTRDGLLLRVAALHTTQWRAAPAV